MSNKRGIFITIGKIVTASLPVIMGFYIINFLEKKILKGDLDNLDNTELMMKFYKQVLKVIVIMWILTFILIVIAKH